MDIIGSRSEKSNCVVIINREDYYPADAVLLSDGKNFA